MSGGNGFSVQLRNTLLLTVGFCGAALLVAARPAPESSPPGAIPRIGWLSTLPAGDESAEAAAEAAMRELSGLPLTWRAGQQLLDDLRETDRRSNLLQQAGQLLSKGRELHLGLKLDLAIRSYQLAIEMLRDGFVRYYNPGRLAEPVLQLGVALLQHGDRTEAHKAFMRAVALSPELELSQGYYSPTVREAFDRARLDLGILAPGIPLPSELARICAADDLMGIVVASTERSGERQIFRLSLFEGRSGALQGVETAMLTRGAAAQAGEQVAGRLRPAVVALAGIAPVLDLDAGNPEDGSESPASGDLDLLADGRSIDGGIEDEEGAHAVDGNAGLDLDGGLMAADLEPVSPWYMEYWWIWPLAAGVVVTAVALPLTVFREDVIDVRVRY